MFKVHWAIGPLIALPAPAPDTGHPHHVRSLIYPEVLQSVFERFARAKGVLARVSDVQEAVLVFLFFVHR